MTDQNIIRTGTNSLRTFQIVINNFIMLFQTLSNLPANRIWTGNFGTMWIDQMNCLHSPSYYIIPLLHHHPD